LTALLNFNNAVKRVGMEGGISGKSYTLGTALLLRSLWFCSHWNKQEQKQDLDFTDPDSSAVSVEDRAICCCLAIWVLQWAWRISKCIQDHPWVSG